MDNVLKKLVFWQDSEPELQLGVFISKDVVWVYQAATDSAPELYADFTLQPNWKDTFEAIKQQFGLAKLHIVLGTSFYQLLQADKPSVDEAEMAQALIWSVKDMTTEPVTNLHLDYFESSISTNSKVNVVIAPRDKMVNFASVCQELGFVVQGITIEEMVLTHVFEQGNNAHILVCHRADQELLLAVVKNGELLMQRRVRGFAQLHTANRESLSYGMADTLSLEIQRSMDYFESQLRQAPVSSINLLIEKEAEVLAQLISANFNQKVNVIENPNVGVQLAKLALGETFQGELA